MPVPHIRQGRPHVILVHGAWHGGWCWQRIIPLLEKAGCQVSAPTLPGHSEHLEEMSLSSYEQALGQLIEASLSPVVLVGHSLAGLVITRLAHLYPEKIQHLIYIAAFIGQPYQSLMDCIFSSGEPPKPNLAIATEADGQIMTLRPEYARDIFYNNCSQSEQDFALARVCPQKTDTFKTPIEYDLTQIAHIPKEYILCTKDNAITVSLQHKMADNVQARVHVLETDHSPFLSQPSMLSDVILANLG